MSSGGDETKTKWTLDLDVEDALGTAEELHNKLEGIGEVESLSGLLETITHVGIALGIVGAAVFAFKEALDLTMEAEQIRAVDAKFEALATNAGIYPEKLKAGLTEASAGLIDQTTLLKAANQAMVGLGDNSARLPEIMNAARPATQLFGGSLVDNFTQMASAIAAGNMRALKHLGIIVDQKKAYRDYAESIGTTADVLSKAGQQTAILNAVLEKTQTAYAGVNADTLATTNSWQQMKTSLTDLKETFILAFDNTIGPSVKRAVAAFASLAHGMKELAAANFGTQTEKDAAKVKQLQNSVASVTKELAYYQQVAAHPGPGQSAEHAAKVVDFQKAKLAELTAQLAKYQATAAAGEKQEEAAIKRLAGVKKAAQVDQDLENKKQQKFMADMDKARTEQIAAELKAATSIAQVDALYAEKQKQLHQKLINDKKKVDLDYGASTGRAAALRYALEQASAAKLKTLDEQQEKDRIASLDEYQRRATSTAEGIGRAFAANAAKAKEELADFGKQGQQTFDAVSSASVSAFSAMGNGSKSAGDAMKDALLGAVGQIAIAKGSLFVSAGIGEMRPDEIAAGGALIALGSFLQSQTSGGGGSAPPAPSGGGGGSPAAPAGAAGAMPASPTSLTQAPQKTVSLTVAGNYYDSNETKTQLMDMIRQATDATDFNYTKVGGK